MTTATFSRRAATFAWAVLLAAGCAPSRTPPPSPPQPPAAGEPGAAAPGGGPGGAAAAGQPRPYNRVITAEARTQRGLFDAHQVGERVYFEIPRAQLGRDMMVAIRTAAGGTTTGFFGGGGQTRYVIWERQANRVLLREQVYDVYADPDSAIAWAVGAMRQGPILASFNVEAWGADSAAVVEVTRLFTTNIPRWTTTNQIQTDRSFVHRVFAFDDAVNVEAWQTGTQQQQAGPGAPAPGGGGQAGQQPVTQLVSFSMRPLPDQPMRARLWDPRVGIGSVRTIDYSRPEHEATERRFIRRFRLEQQTPGSVSEPREKVIFWIDRATPAWLVPWVEAGVAEWVPAYEAAGFRNAIEGRLAPRPEEDPSFSIYDARRHAIYWRPSTVANATGGQVVDPRTGEILKAEVNMYHNVMNLLRNWYFVQVSPLDVRAQRLPLPDSLMGRLVQYVVAHEIGHAIGFPHNMKASAMYPADSIRSEGFLRRKGGHVATLMDYSRFNYVVQPEDNIPPELLIPIVGPYDHFAITYQNMVIPGTSSPDDERAVLDQWASQQDTIPWFRFSTSDATADPHDLTEAVGDEDAVKSSGLGMRNLERVAGSLLRIAEQPGRDYALLSELYGNTVAQWGRYNGHVAAIIGGAETQERLGTGVRFLPFSRAKQREAMQYLGQNAFRVPGFLVDPEVLRRIEQEGAVRRVRQAQSNVLNTLFAKTRLDRLIEYEALAGGRGDYYSAGDMLSDLRGGVWTELTQGAPRIDVYRRNLQRAYLEAIDRTLNPPEPPQGAPAQVVQQAQQQRWESDVRPLLRGELAELNTLVGRALNRATDAMTRLHLQDVRMEIERMLDVSR